MISSLKSFSLAIFNRKLCVAINSGYTEPQKSADTKKVYHKKKCTEEFQKCFKVNQRRTVGLQSKVRKVFRDPYPTLIIRTLCLTHSSTERQKKTKHLHQNNYFGWVWRKQRSHRIQSFYLNNPGSVHIGVASKVQNVFTVENAGFRQKIRFDPFVILWEVLFHSTEKIEISFSTVNIDCSRNSQVQKFWPRHFVKNCSM